MTKQFERYGLLTIGGMLTIVFYCSFTLISWGLYPSEYWPTTHYLSRLGDYIYSPIGAYFYNIGCITTGIALFPFFVGVRELAVDRYFQKYILGIGQALGLASAVALIMIGVYSENTGSPHIMASTVFFLLNFFVLIIIGIAMILNTEISKIIPAYVIAFDLFSAGLALSVGGPISEWITVFGSLVFVGLVVLHSIRAREVIKRME